MPGYACPYRGLESDDFLFVHRNRRFSNSYDLDDSRGRKNGETIQQIESAKQVTREERDIKFLHTIRPAPLTLIEGQENLVAPATQLLGGEILVPRPGLDCKPRMGLICVSHVHRP